MVRALSGPAPNQATQSLFAEIHSICLLSSPTQTDAGNVGQKHPAPTACLLTPPPTQIPPRLSGVRDMFPIMPGIPHRQVSHTRWLTPASSSHGSSTCPLNICQRFKDTERPPAQLLHQTRGFSGETQSSGTLIHTIPLPASKHANQITEKASKV